MSIHPRNTSNPTCWPFKNFLGVVVIGLGNRKNQLTTGPRSACAGVVSVLIFRSIFLNFNFNFNYFT